MFKTELSTLVYGTAQEVKNLHITAHSMRPVDGRDCYKIKHTLLTKGDDVYDRSILVRDRRRRGLVWPVTSVFSGAPLGESFSFPQDSGDELIRLIGYRGVGESLNFTIYVTTGGIVLPRVQGFGMHTVAFSAMSLTVYFGFFHMVNPMYSIFRDPCVGSMRKNGTLLGSGVQQATLERMTPDGVGRYLLSSHSTLADDYLWAGPHNHPHTTVLRGKFEVPLFSRWPRENDEIHEAYGLGSKLINETYQSPFFSDGTRKPEGYVDPTGIIVTHPNTLKALNAASVAPRIRREPT